MNPLKTGPWNLTDLKEVKPLNKTVFSCFHCGGGSTMGYKLAGYEVLGGVEIDPEMASIYKINHNPKYQYVMGVKEFNKLPNEELPKELFNLDILDGSPPCSSFSMAGSREKAWGEKKKFREGQAHQVLDDLFFDFIETAQKLKPKVVVAENVKGLIQGKAKGYVKQIFQKLNDAGYDVQLFLLNAAFMGVPQRRERTFFIAKRKDLNFPAIKMEFNEQTISFQTATKNININYEEKLTETAEKYWKKCLPGKSFSRVHEKGSLFNWIKINPNEPLPTLVSRNAEIMFHGFQKRKLNEKEWILGQTFPNDYNFMKSKTKYVCGMSVPPFMMQRISDQIYKQWLVNYVSNG